MIRLLSYLFFGQKNILALTILLAIATPCLAQKYMEVYQDGNLAGSMFSADIDSISFTGNDTASRHINFWSKGNLTNSYLVYTVDSIISGEDFYDSRGKPAGYSMDGILGGHDYFDAGGKRVGWSTDSLFGGENIRLDDDPFGSGSQDDFGSPGWDE